MENITEKDCWCPIFYLYTHDIFDKKDLIAVEFLYIKDIGFETWLRIKGAVTQYGDIRIEDIYETMGVFVEIKDELKREIEKDRTTCKFSLCYNDMDRLSKIFKYIYKEINNLRFDGNLEMKSSKYSGGK